MEQRDIKYFCVIYFRLKVTALESQHAKSLKVGVADTTETHIVTR